MKRIFYSKSKREKKQLSSLDVNKVPKLPELPNVLIPAHISRVIDGDTVEVVFLHGGKIPMKVCIRIIDVDTPELRAKRKLERQAARYVKKKIEEILFANKKTIKITFEKWDECANRIVGDIHIGDECGYLSDYLIFHCYAQIYNGKTKIEWSESCLEDILEDKC